MLVICLSRPISSKKRTHHYKIVVKDSRYHITSNKVVEEIGYIRTDSFKHCKIDKEKLLHWYKIGAQPSDRVFSIANAEGISLPDRSKKKKSSNTKKETKKDEPKKTTTKKVNKSKK